MADIGKYIKRRRLELGMTQEYLAEKMGYKSKTSINKIENGTNDVSQTKVAQFAKVLDCTISYLMGLTDSKLHTSGTGAAIPVLGTVIAGIPIEAVEHIIDYEEISQEMANTGDFFGLRIKGDSMEPRIQEGDVVIVRKQSDVDDGDLAIVLVNGHEATCKRIKRYSDALMLISTNPKYEPMVYTADQVRDLPVQIIGKVVENRQKY